MTEVFHWHHKVPKHMGGTDDESNLVRVSISEHAEFHKKLYEEHGKWEDYIAWKCLSGQIDGASVALEINKARAKARTGPKNPQWGKPGPWKGKKRPSQSEKMKNQEYRRKKYEVTCPDGSIVIVTGLIQFCKERSINASNLCQVAKGKKTQANGYRCRAIE